MAVITPLPGKGATWKLGSTVYQFSKWDFTITLESGEVKHFAPQTDAGSNSWATVFTNFAKAEGSASGFVDHASNSITVGGGLYVGQTGTVSCLWSTTDGFTFPAVITENNTSADAAAADPGAYGIKFVATGPPTRVFS